MKTPLSTAFGQWAMIAVAIILLVGMSLVVSANLRKHPRLVVVSSDSRYITDGDFVYMNNALISGAKPDSFKVFIGTDYASDAVHVFYMGAVLQGADVIGFSAVGISGYAKDSQSVFFNGTKMSANPASFALASSNSDTDYYGKDASSAFYEDQAIAGSDPVTFTVLQNGYSSDVHAVYYLGDKVSGADIATFVVVNYDMNNSGALSYDAKDKNHEYLQGQRVK